MEFIVTDQEIIKAVIKPYNLERLKRNYLVRKGNEKQSLEFKYELVLDLIALPIRSANMDSYYKDWRTEPIGKYVPNFVSIHSWVLTHAQIGKVKPSRAALPSATQEQQLNLVNLILATGIREPVLEELKEHIINNLISALRETPSGTWAKEQRADYVLPMYDLKTRSKLEAIRSEFFNLKDPDLKEKLFTLMGDFMISAREYEGKRAEVLANEFDVYKMGINSLHTLRRY